MVIRTKAARVAVIRKSDLLVTLEPDTMLWRIYDMREPKHRVLNTKRRSAIKAGQGRRRHIFDTLN
jgi:hypothetical protein